MRIDRLEIGFAAFLLGFGLFIIFRAVHYGILGSTVTGAGFFPFLSGALLTLASGAILAGFIRGTRETDETIELSSLWPVAAIAGVTVVFLLVVESIGMLLLTPFYVAAVAAILEQPAGIRAYLKLLAVALGFTFFAWLLFAYGLRIPLPRGIL